MLASPEKAYIYGLRDPRCSDVIWYVGKTNNVRTRLQYHIKDAKLVARPTPVQKWICRLLGEGVKPTLSVLAECPFSEWKERERAHIALHRKKNLLLLNKHDGGNGTAVKGRKEFCDKCGTKRVRLYPSDGSLRCPICRKAQRRAYEIEWNAAHPEYTPNYNQKYYTQNQNQLREASSKYYYDNREYCLKRDLERYHRNKQKAVGA